MVLIASHNMWFKWMVFKSSWCWFVGLYFRLSFLLLLSVADTRFLWLYFASSLSRRDWKKVSVPVCCYGILFSSTYWRYPCWFWIGFHRFHPWWFPVCASQNPYRLQRWHACSQWKCHVTYEPGSYLAGHPWQPSWTTIFICKWKTVLNNHRSTLITIAKEGLKLKHFNFSRCVRCVSILKCLGSPEHLLRWVKCLISTKSLLINTLHLEGKSCQIHDIFKTAFGL